MNLKDIANVFYEEKKEGKLGFNTQSCEESMESLLLLTVWITVWQVMSSVCIQTGSVAEVTQFMLQSV